MKEYLNMTVNMSLDKATCSDDGRICIRNG